MRAGYAKVAGVVTDDVKDELRKLTAERGLPSLSQAVGAALAAWALTRSAGVQNPRVGRPGHPPLPASEALGRARESTVRVAAEDLADAICSVPPRNDSLAPGFSPVLDRESDPQRLKAGSP